MLPGAPHIFVTRGRQVDRYATIEEADAVTWAAVANADQVRFGCFPLLTLGDLAFRAGVSYVFLRAVIGRRIDPYRKLRGSTIRGSKARPIVAPVEALMRTQRWINQEILAALPVHSHTFAYARGKSIIDCARRHAGCEWIIKTDIHDYFHSISENAIYKVFKDIGYNSLLSFELARLTTRPIAARMPEDSIVAKNAQSYTIIEAYQASQMGWLPQGAPTSGALANTATRGLDATLSSWARERALVYSRYSDDIVFSSTQKFDRHRAAGYIGEIQRLISSHGLHPHERKTKIISPGGRKIVLGLLVGGDEPRLRPEAKRLVMEHIRGVKVFGLEEHAAHRGFNSIFSFIRHVEGHLTWAKAVEPDWAQRQFENWTAVLLQHPLLSTIMRQ